MSAGDPLPGLVAARGHGLLPGAEQVQGLLRGVVSQFPETTDSHAVWWHHGAWLAADVWSSRIRTRLSDLVECLRQPASNSEDGWTRISRGDVFDRARVGGVDVFLAAMAWGFGPRGYGWRRTSEIIRDAGEAPVERAVEEIRQAAVLGPSRVWQAWARGGKAKIRGVDTAFASKIAYFVAFDRSSGRGPLIADNNTAWAVWALAGNWDSRATASQYAEYVGWTERQAAALECRSDDVERALFILGPGVMRAWRKPRANV